MLLNFQRIKNKNKIKNDNLEQFFKTEYRKNISKTKDRPGEVIDSIGICGFIK